MGSRHPALHQSTSLLELLLRTTNMGDNQAGSEADTVYKTKFVDRVFTLPLITDGYNRMANMTAPIQLYVKTSIDYVDNVACAGFDKVIESAPCLQKYGVTDVYKFGSEALNKLPANATEYWNSSMSTVNNAWTSSTDYISSTKVGQQVMRGVNRFDEERVKKDDSKEEASATGSHENSKKPANATDMEYVCLCIFRMLFLT